MRFLYGLLCDHAFLSLDKKVNIIGVFETINAHKFPITHPKFVIVGSIAPTKSKFKMKLNITGKDAKNPILGDIKEREVNLPETEKKQNFNFIVEVINANFASAGEYTVEILIDEKVVGEIPFKVLESKMPTLSPPS